MQGDSHLTLLEYSSLLICRKCPSVSKGLEVKTTMATKEWIIAEIQRVASQLGRSPGKRVFENEAGIKESEWKGKFWRSWSDAQKEANVQENNMSAKLSNDFLFEKFAVAVRHFGRIPAVVDLRMYARQNGGFPDSKTLYDRFDGKGPFVAAFSVWALNTNDWRDLPGLLPELSKPVEQSNETIREGSVYLLRSGDHYKIGRSDQLEKRIRQITVKLPENAILDHTIRTDDPSGIEAYWHRRFADRRANGEWFKLTKADVKAFKRRHYQ